MKFNLKDPLPTFLQSKVIYEYKCPCEQRYVGRTEQRLYDRIKQHVPYVIRSGRQNHPKPDEQTSAIVKHLCESEECAKAYTQDCFSVLSSARTKFHLSTLEAAYISATKPILCRQKSFVYTWQVFN